jgi:hypothetical protein
LFAAAAGGAILGWDFLSGWGALVGAVAGVVVALL